MAVEDNAATHGGEHAAKHGSGMFDILKGKVGPVPVWVLAILGVIAGVFILNRSASKSSAPAADATGADAVSGNLLPGGGFAANPSAGAPPLSTGTPTDTTPGSDVEPPETATEPPTPDPTPVTPTPPTTPTNPDGNMVRTDSTLNGVVNYGWLINTKTDYTLASIARSYGISTATLRALNPTLAKAGDNDVILRGADVKLRSNAIIKPVILGTSPTLAASGKATADPYSAPKAVSASAYKAQPAPKSS